MSTEFQAYIGDNDGSTYDDVWLQCALWGDPVPDYLRHNDTYLELGWWTSTDAKRADIMLRWQNAGANAIPAGATIDSAYLRLTAFSDSNLAINLDYSIQAFDYKSMPALTDNPPFPTYARYHSGVDVSIRDQTVVWPIASGTWLGGTHRTSLDLSAVFQDLWTANCVEVGDWFGIYMRNLMAYPGGAPLRIMRASDLFAADSNPRITINWTAAAAGNPWYNRRLMKAG